MTTLCVWRLCRIRLQRFPVRSLGSLPNAQSPHVYMKTYTKEELVKYLSDNVVYSSSDYVATCVPQGVKFLNHDRWNDSDSRVICESSLQDMIPELCEIFQTNYCFVTKHPRRNASGLVILSRNFLAFRSLRNYFVRAMKDSTRIYTYLAVVFGSPPEDVNKTFRVEQVSEDNKLSVQILEKAHLDSNKTVQTKYDHKVVDRVDNVSLVKISVSYDLRDCIRHILAQRFFTPVLGDFWSAKRTVTFLFGAPILGKPCISEERSYEMKSLITGKLQLSEDQLKYTPIHIHLYGVKMTLRNHSEFFVSVPPPESFLWTCQQLGLNGIEEFAPGLLQKEETNLPR